MITILQAKRQTGPSCDILAANIESIVSFGDDIPHRLVSPILQGCSAESLSRLERETPRLKEHTSELWRDICTRSYPLAVEQMLNPAREGPSWWRDEFFRMREREAMRLEEAASRIRSQRIEAEELKRKRQVKLTDRLPPPKRSRSGCPTPPKTLFEKTRKEATKIQNSVFGSRCSTPAIRNSKGFQLRVDASSAEVLAKDAKPVLVNTITVRKPCPNSKTPLSQANRKPEPPKKALVQEQQRRAELSPEIPAGALHKHEKSVTKKPIPSLFVPKQRISAQVSSIVSFSTTSSSR